MRVLDAAIEHVDLPAEAFDLAVCATAFHCLDPAVAVPVFARALRPAAPWRCDGPCSGTPSGPRRSARTSARCTTGTCPVRSCRRGRRHGRCGSGSGWPS
ncbi:class I SAM-dependent methyltransferase [Longispora fulva]|uniref:class I SAM-dependent methyltransferase n=1 Tax=Longispora fulva TaxID=619741 RepID=UPI00355747AD